MIKKLIIFSVLVLIGCNQAIPIDPEPDSLTRQEADILLYPKSCRLTDSENQENLLFFPGGILNNSWLMEDALFASFYVYSDPEDYIPKIAELKYFSNSVSGPYCSEEFLKFDIENRELSYVSTFSNFDTRFDSNCDSSTEEKREEIVYILKNETVYKDGDLVSDNKSKQVLNTIKYLDMAIEKMEKGEPIVQCEQEIK